MALLGRYSWPGNVRELRNVMERAALLCGGRTIRADDLGSSLSASRDASSSDSVDDDVAARLPLLRLDSLERLAIEEALAVAEWHQGRAAELLGISDRTLYRKIRSLGLHRPQR